MLQRRSRGIVRVDDGDSDDVFHLRSFTSEKCSGRSGQPENISTDITLL
jgi:hypothetical protein